MALKNIENVQLNNHIFEQEEKEQYIQALANAGQRIGTKGDSITLDQFNFTDIIKQYASFDVDQYKDDYIGKIAYSLDYNGIPQCNFALLSKDNFRAGLFDNVEQSFLINYKDIFNVYNTDQFGFDIQLNNYTFIKENSMFKLDKNYFTTVLFAKILGSDELNVKEDITKYNLELHYNKYNTITNKLEYAIRVFHINEYENPTFAMLEYSLVNDNLGIYSLNAWYLTISKNKQMDIQTFENYLCNQTNSLRHKYDVFSLLESLDISNSNILLDNNSKVTTIFSYIIKYGTKINNTNIYLKFNSSYSNGYEQINYNLATHEESNIINTGEELYNIFSAYNQLIDKYDITIENRLYYMCNDISILYPRLLEKYCTDLFFSNTSSLAKQMLCRLYENILVEYSKNTNIGVNTDDNMSIYDILINNENNIIMYVPLNYDIKYYCNAQNRNQIYNSNDIYVSFINNLHDLTYNKLQKIVESSRNIIIDYDDVDKTSIYQFTIDYNEDLNNSSLLIRNISLDKLYTLPYIDKATACWVINDTITNFKTIADIAPSQMFLLTYNTIENNKLTYQILNGLSNDIEEMFNTTDNSNETLRWIEKKCVFSTDILVGRGPEVWTELIEDYENEGAEHINLVTVRCKVPHIRVDSNLVSTFENTLLITICDKTTFIDSIPQKYKDAINASDIYNAYTMVALWKLSVEKIVTTEDGISYYSFDYVRKISKDGNSHYAFDASDIFNTNIAEIRTALTPKNIFDGVLFYNSSVIVPLKDNYPNTNHLISIFSPNSNYYRNRISVLNKYADNETISSQQFNNNYILSIQPLNIDYNDIATRIFDTTELEPHNIKNQSFFIELIDNNRSNISVCNAFYKRTNINNLIDSDTISSNYNYSYGESIINNEIESNNVTQIVPISNSKYYSNKDKIQNNNVDTYVNEYIFAGNVPMLDLKEIFLLNSSSINRYNIIYPQANTIFNAFMGLPINDELDNIFIYNRDESTTNNLVNPHTIVEIAASETNINIGNDTLLSQTNKNNFSKQQTLYTKFNNTVIESENIFYRIKWFSDIICGGGLSASFTKNNTNNTSSNIEGYLNYTPNVLVKSSNLNASNKDNIPVITEESTSLIEHLDEANTKKFGFGKDNSHESNVLLFTKEFTPISVILDYAKISDSETRAFANYFNILWYGDKWYRDNEEDKEDKKIYVKDNNIIKCGLSVLSKYDSFTSTLQTIFGNYATNYGIQYKQIDVLQDLNYLDVNYDLIPIENMSINAFFLSKVHPDELKNIYEECFKENKNDIAILSNIIYGESHKQDANDLDEQNNTKDKNQHLLEFLDNKKRIYIFRLSDYLYTQYGLDITNGNKIIFDEDLTAQNRIFRIALNNSESDIKKYAYFLIYEEEDLEIHQFRYSKNDIYLHDTIMYKDEINKNVVEIDENDININYYEVAYPKRPIKLIKRKIVNYPTVLKEIAGSSCNKDVYDNISYVYNILF